MARSSAEVVWGKLQFCLRERVPGHQHYVECHSQKRERSSNAAVPGEDPEKHMRMLVLNRAFAQGVLQSVCVQHAPGRNVRVSHRKPAEIKD